MPINGADTGWVLVCAALVLFMTPGLALFYGGTVRSSTVLVMLQQNIVPLGIVSLTWVVVGYSLAFGTPSDDKGFFGSFQQFLLGNLDTAPTPARHVVNQGADIPTLAFVAYQMMFAIITPALITGATADRLRLGGWAIFLTAWSILVYPIVAHWLFNPSGWLAVMGAQDWAGGIVVHACAGAAALAVMYVIGRRKDWPDASETRHSIPLVIIGAGILWFGWFGFNAGDGLGVNDVTAQALLNTHVAAAAGMLAWLAIEWRREGHPTVLGAVTGAVAGLATITPCAGFVDSGPALLIGLIAGAVCPFAIKLKFRFRYDDALDVIAVHFLGGILGSLLLGVFGSSAVNADGRDGLLYGGGATLLTNQVIALAVVIAFSFVATYIIATVIQRTVGLRTDPADEARLDEVQQGATAYIA
jgi:ammonium transporter